MKRGGIAVSAIDNEGFADCEVFPEGGPGDATSSWTFALEEAGLVGSASELESGGMKVSLVERDRF